MALVIMEDIFFGIKAVDNFMQALKAENNVLKLTFKHYRGDSFTADANISLQKFSDN